MADLDELALAMPEAAKEISDDGRPRYSVHGKMFCIHRSRRPDAIDPETGERMDDVLLFRVDGLEAKELMLADPRGIFFTTPHFDGWPGVLIRIPQQPGGEEAQQQAVAKVRATLGDAVDYRRVEVVGPRISKELLGFGTLGLLLAILGILIYLWFRFEWQFALGAMIANVHDIVLTIGFMALFQLDFDLSSIAALLTILGYSLNDTVVIYDRIREMLRRYKKMPMPQLLNESINSTLSRSIITHVTVTLALLALLLFGGQAIHSFTAVMMFGVVLVGTYTSIFIAAPILIYLGVGTHRSDAPETPAKKTAAPVKK